MEICPFFGKTEDHCDVGSGYLSAFDVQTIATHCSNHFDGCGKYQELSCHYPEIGLMPILARAQKTGLGRPATQNKPINIAFRNKWPLPFRLQYLQSQSLPTGSFHEEEIVKNPSSLSKAWSVVVAGTGINLALGILYAYSMLKGDIAKLFNGAGDPYATACLVFAVAMILGGKMQDKVGPRLTAILGGLLVGAGFLICSQTSSYWGWILGFGVFAGAGFGFGYSAATPPALKWFSPAKTGLIAGIVVSGFGIAPVYLAPVCKYLLGSYGLHSTMLVLGIAFIVIVCGMALLVANPPAGYVPAGGTLVKSAREKTAVDKSVGEMLKDGRFYTCWLTFFIGAGAGLMVIGSLAGIAKHSMGEMAFIAVAVMSLGNASGRVIAGVLSDKIGRATTLTLMLVFQAILMFAAIPVVTGNDSSALVVTLLATFIGFNYGTNLSLFPSFAKDYWGVKNYGMNYGVLFSAWGVGAFVLVKLSAALNAKFGSFTVSLTAAGVMLLVGAMLSRTLQEKKAAVTVEVPQTLGIEEEDLVLQKAGN
jgi:MFS family permease